MKNDTTPHAHDLELAVLGGAMISPKAAEKLEAVPAEIFYNPANFLTCQAIQELRKEGMGTDIILVKNYLRKTNRLQDIGGASHLVECTMSVVNAANFDYHLTVLKEKYMIREMIAHKQASINRLMNGADVFDEIQATEEKCNEIVLGAVGKVMKSTETIAKEYLERLQKIRESDSRIIGIPSGIMPLDIKTRGWMQAELIIIAGRPAMGKSDLALFLARFASLTGHKTGFVSLEMGEYQIMNRLVSMEGTTPKGYTDSKDQAEAVEAAAIEIVKSGIRIIDPGSVDTAQLKTVCRKLVREGCKMIIIDYLQLVRTPGKDRYDKEIGDITRMLKGQIAKEFEIPVILLSQLNRKVEETADKRPKMMHLKESSSIEQDADKIIFLYRPEYYGLHTNEEGETTAGLCELIIEKQREAETCTIRTLYQREYGIFEPWKVLEPSPF